MEDFGFDIWIESKIQALQVYFFGMVPWIIGLDDFVLNRCDMMSGALSTRSPKREKGGS